MKKNLTWLIAASFVFVLGAPTDAAGQLFNFDKKKAVRVVRPGGRVLRAPKLSIALPVIKDTRMIALANQVFDGWNGLGVNDEFGDEDGDGIYNIADQCQSTPHVIVALRKAYLGPGENVSGYAEPGVTSGGINSDVNLGTLKLRYMRQYAGLAAMRPVDENGPATYNGVDKYGNQCTLNTEFIVDRERINRIPCTDIVVRGIRTDDAVNNTGGIVFFLFSRLVHLSNDVTSQEWANKSHPYYPLYRNDMGLFWGNDQNRRGCVMTYPHDAPPVVP